ncbi:hypothetical protein MOBT1_002617 [Malassezia obtusa]|uniref:SUN domain-containing protein n=1 Tax=Malassezia obtusa TaxID=76774 RepID=A0AAF0ISQ3_9BASI|nr:hypothetical protein MOBT1_002617 [Malassezia obtusa]
MLARAVAAAAALVAAAAAAAPGTGATRSQVHITTGSAAPRFAELRGSLTCVSPLARAMQLDGAAPAAGRTALHDPRSTLIGDEILVCEIPWEGGARTPDGMHRIYAVLGTMLVPDTPAQAAPALAGVAPPPAHEAARTHTDPLLSFSEWKEQRLEHERLERARSKQRDKARSAERPANGTAPPRAASTLASPAPVPPSAPPAAGAVRPPPLTPAPEVHAVENAPEALAKLKHRWNYASLDCAAVLHQANPAAKFPTAILSEKKDRYMLSPCPVSERERQFVVVELCQQVRIDTLVLANLEFFSSMFKRFVVRLSNDLHAPEHEWRTLGHFRARNVRGLQVFTLGAVPQTYYRFLRIDFLEHYGSEYYCPVSLLRVYGRNEREDADEVDDEDAERGADDAEAEAPPTPAGGAPADTPPPPAPSAPPPPEPAPRADPDVDVLRSCDVHLAAIRGRLHMCPPRAPSVWPCVCVPRAAPPPAVAPHTPPANATAAPPANATARAKSSDKGDKSPGGESIFRTITKRLAALETNTSLSMQYLQLSSQVLRDKLTELEHAQHTRLAHLFASLNASYTQQLHTHTSEWRAALAQRDAAHAALAARVEQLAAELVYEKRRGFAQLVLLFVLLLLLVLERALAPAARAPPATAVHTPRAQRATSLERVLSPLRRAPPSPDALHDESALVASLEHAADDLAREAPRTPLTRVQDAARPARPVASVKYPHARGAAGASPGVRRVRLERARLAARAASSTPRHSVSSSSAAGSEWSDGEESVHS